MKNKKSMIYAKINELERKGLTEDDSFSKFFYAGYIEALEWVIAILYDDGDKTNT